MLIFGLSGEANRLLSAQFEGRSARKSYVFYSAAPPPPRLRAPAARPRAGSTGGGGAIGAVAEATEEADGWLRVRSFVRRDGERYASSAAATPGAEVRARKTHPGVAARAQPTARAGLARRRL